MSFPPFILRPCAEAYTGVGHWRSFTFIVSLHKATWVFLSSLKLLLQYFCLVCVQFVWRLMHCVVSGSYGTPKCALVSLLLESWYNNRNGQQALLIPAFRGTSWDLPFCLCMLRYWRYAETPGRLQEVERKQAFIFISRIVCSFSDPFLACLLRHFLVGCWLTSCRLTKPQ